MNYLRVRSGPHLFLFATSGILEVLDEATDQRLQDTQGNTLWRGRVVRKISLRQWFGNEAGMGMENHGTMQGATPQEERVRIVHQGYEDPVVYLVDAVLGLSQLEDQDLLPLPPLPRHLLSCFDRAWPDLAGQRLFLRCRLPFVNVKWPESIPGNRIKAGRASP